MAMESLERMRDKSIPTTIPALIPSHLINALELHLRPILSTKDGWQWKASNEWGRNPFQRQFRVLIHRHLINGLELHIHTILSTEDRWWRAASKDKRKIHSNNNSLAKFIAILATDQRTRAALTHYIINKRRMSLGSLDRMRDKSLPTTIPCPDS